MDFLELWLFFYLFVCLKSLSVFLPLQRINFHEDWKVITVLIGGGDLCDYCTDSVMGGSRPAHCPWL